MILVLVLVGQVMETAARERTGDAIRALMGLAPKTARRLDDWKAKPTWPLDEVQVGDRLRVRPGESVPVDGGRHRGPCHHRREHDHRRADPG